MSHPKNVEVKKRKYMWVTNRMFADPFADRPSWLGLGLEWECRCPSFVA